MRIAYLASRYPQVSHTFIQREVLAARSAGAQIETFAIRRALPDEVLSRADEEEAERTTSILPVSPGRLLGVHLRALRSAPRRYLHTLARAVALSPGGPRGTLWQLFYFAEAILMWDHCRARGLSHIHVHFANVAADVALLAVDFGAGDGPRTWSLTMHGPTEFADVRHHRLAEKVADAAFVVCISDFARSQVMALLPEDQWDKLEIVHCGVDVSAYAPSPDGAGSGAGPLRVLCVGRLVPEKGQAVLLEAIARLRAAGREVSCTFVGEGPSRPALERAVAARGLAGAVQLTGAVGQDEMRSLYRGADVFCLPSFAEGVPVVLMEAMSMQLPVVTTRIAGIPELVSDGADGYVVAPGSADELTRALAELAGDPELRRRLGAHGRETVSAGFDMAAIGPQLAGIFGRRAGR